MLSFIQIFFVSSLKTSSKVSGTYPHISTLLMLDVGELFNVLSIAFEEKEFQTMQTDQPPFVVSKRQQVVDILLEV